MKQPAILTLRDITFCHSIQSTPVLDDFNMEFRQGQRLGLIGPNGCGKTTLFHIIMGLHEPTSGSILFRGKELSDKKDFDILRKEIGLLFQDADDQLFSPTVLEDIAFGPLNLGATPQEAKDIAVRTLNNLGLDDFANRITHQLSGGEKKLVSLATILAMEPKAVLLDEPTNNLDPATRHKLIHILRDLDVAYIIISHDWDFLSDTCDDIYSMQNGKVTDCGKAHLHNHSHAHAHGEQPHRHGHGRA
ncbi:MULTISPECIES: energy-coupling factor ABC transporter ATP-binding protein [Desulfosediminicola]|uniref:energy-coupling factor ABC transporter ATP-binding protein n=1 Tax=Desulfosediminicola TaxID=2886823 RepID=UPI0010ABDDD0|nr:ABC transporter ATP-binding protein [Desulfosediminicola ganghwensis]